MKIIEKLSTYAALLGVIGAIGGGFYTWGQFNSRLDAIEATPPVNLKPLKNWTAIYWQLLLHVILGEKIGLRKVMRQ